MSKPTAGKWAYQAEPENGGNFIVRSTDIRSRGYDSFVCDCGDKEANADLIVRLHNADREIGQ